MALKIRLRQQGRKNHTVYRFVLADTRSPRDGKFLETLGWYNPYAEDLAKKMFVQAERVMFWLEKGATPSERVVTLLKQSSPELVQAYQKKIQQQMEKLRDKRKELRREKGKKES